MIEEWKPVEGYPSYAVSNYGRIMRTARGKSTRPGRILAPITDANGYLRIGLCEKGKSKHPRIHALVASAFLGPRPDGHEINHIDHDRSNNRVENLEYVTHPRNMQHSIMAGRFNRQKLMPDEVREIRQLISEGVMGIHIASRFGVAESQISRIKHGHRWSRLS
jgi:hypothetical protein